jgi:anti-anti-sigma regulatory factor
MEKQHVQPVEPIKELSPHRPLRVECTDETIVATLGDRSLSDMSVVADLGNLAKRAGERQFTINLVNVRYLNGSELGRLVAIHKLLQAKGRRLGIMNANAIIQQILGVTRLNLLLETTTTRRRAAKTVA